MTATAVVAVIETFTTHDEEVSNALLALGWNLITVAPSGDTEYGINIMYVVGRTDDVPASYGPYTRTNATHWIVAAGSLDEARKQLSGNGQLHDDVVRLNE